MCSGMGGGRMAATLGTYSIPKEFKDEDKWFRFFTKTQLMYIGAGLLLGIGALKITYSLGILPLGVILCEIFLEMAAILSFLVIPSDRYLIGGGYPLRLILARLVKKRMSTGRVIYVKCFPQEQGDGWE